MNHYEAVLIIHPDKSDQINDIIEDYTKIINTNHGKIHRLEDWGRKQLSYSINKLQKAHYLLINFEISKNALKEIKSSLKYNSFIVRSMILKIKKAVLNPSPMLKHKDDIKDNK